MTTPGTTIFDAATSPALGPDPTRDVGALPETTGPELQRQLDEVHGELSAADNKAAADSDVGELAVPTVAAYRDGEGRVHYASPFSKRTLAKVAAQEWAEVDPYEPPFDPTDKLVRDVVAYLEENAADEAEVARVKAAEAEGENRPTIARWTPDTVSDEEQ